MEKEIYTVLRTRLLEVYHQLGITNEEMLFLIHLISFQQQQDEFPSIQRLQERMHYSDEQMYDAIETLMERGILRIEALTNEKGLARERYSLLPLYEKVQQLENQSAHAQNLSQQKQNEGEVFEIIETEFGRQLSPIEYQQVSSWFAKDKFEVETVKAAVKEAVLNQVYNLKYIDRILINWKKQNRQAGTGSRQRNLYQRESMATKSELPPVPLDKWLNR